MKKFTTLVAGLLLTGSMSQAGYVVDCKCPSNKTCANFKFEVEPSNNNFMVVRYGKDDNEVRILEGIPLKKTILKKNQLSVESMALGNFILALENGEYFMPGREVTCERK